MNRPGIRHAKVWIAVLVIACTVAVLQFAGPANAKPKRPCAPNCLPCTQKLADGWTVDYPDGTEITFHSRTAKRCVSSRAKTVSGFRRVWSEPASRRS